MFHTRVSSMIFNLLGVNQVGVGSGILFRKYMADLESYLSTAHGICINEEIIVHLLWADDLILFSDTFHGLQIQLDGLKSWYLVILSNRNYSFILLTSRE